MIKFKMRRGKGKEERSFVQIPISSKESLPPFPVICTYIHARTHSRKQQRMHATHN